MGPAYTTWRISTFPRSDFPAVDMKEVLQQRMFEDKSYLDHEDHKNLFEALGKSLERDYSNQLLSDLEEAHREKRKKHVSPRNPFGYESTGVFAAHESSPTDSLMNEDSIPEEHVQLSNDEDTRNDHLPNADIRKGWWKPLPEEERPATPEPAWTIPYSNISYIRDMTTFMNWYCSKVNKTVLTQADFEGQTYETNPEGDQVRIDVSQPLPLGGPPGHLTIQTEFFSNKDLEYLRYGNKGSRPALSISKMKVARYPDFGLELQVPEEMWIHEKFCIKRHDSLSCRKEVKNHMRILSVVSIKAYSRYGYDYLSEIVLRRADFREYKIAKKDFKNLYPSDFEDLNLLLLQDNLDHLSGSDKRMLSTVVKLWTQNLVIRQRVEDFQLGIESYQKQLNLTKPGWDVKGYEFKHDYTIIESPRAVVFPKDMTRSKEFMSAINRRLKARRIYQNLECFVGGRVRDIDYRLL
ncbi:hypothetical protein Tco_0937492 [Tanacetum coccineum]|uniref:Uncharacterized protein n=1 Tax=Tanacetum coccineum TaxID=301880 RepID=A0ABQ5DFH6_9ASTR